MAAQWQPLSRSNSTGSLASLASQTGSQSSVSTASTTGSFKYVAPGLRRERNMGRVKVEVAELGNKLAEANREAAKHQGPDLPKFNLPFFLKKDKMQFLQSRFPRTTFRVTSDNAHDHPLAHTETMIATSKALRMVPQGHFIIDVYGSPADADRFNASQAKANVPKHMVPYCARMSEKDFLRASKWGNTHHADGRRRYFEGMDGESVVSGMLATEPNVTWEYPEMDGERNVTYFLKHTLYYLTDEDICQLLAPDGTKMVAVIHRHANMQGQLFDGECTYGKKGATVEQVNVLTGERYTHRDLSYLWDSTTKVVRTAFGAYTWTFHMVSEETWIIELIACNAYMDERFASREKAVGRRSAAAEMVEHSCAPSSFPHPAMVNLPLASCKMVGGVPFVSFGGGLLPPLKLTNTALYDYLRASVVGKPRDTERLHDLFALARTQISNGSDFPGKRNFSVAPEEIADHVMLAFLSGLQKEVDLLRAAEGYKTYAKEHKALLDGSAIVVPGVSYPETSGRSLVAVLRRVNVARKAGDVLTGVLDLVD